MNNLLKTVKQSLSIVETSTLKDEEIEMLINAGKEDLIRQGINADDYIDNELIKTAIIMFVKANFGNVDIKEKELAQERYSLMCNQLGLSSDYKESDSNA